MTEPGRFRAGICPVCGHAESAHTHGGYWQCTACGGRCRAPEPPDEWYRDPNTGEMYDGWERALWHLDALPPATRRGLILHVRGEIERWTRAERPGSE